MRVKLPNRRPSETRCITYTFEGGREARILITIGFDDDGAPKEVFCADFKCGTTLHSEVMDACVLVSRLLQYGEDASELSGAMCEGPSLIGTILNEVSQCHGPRTMRDDSGAPVDPDKPLVTDDACLAELAQ